MPETVSDIVPGAQACSRESPTGTAGNCQRSWSSPQRSTMRRVSDSAMTQSVFNGRCGPCCSTEPMGRHSTELACTAVATSLKTSWPIIRLTRPTGMGSAAHHALKDAVPKDEVMVQRRPDMNDDQCRDEDTHAAVDDEHRFGEGPIFFPDRRQVEQPEEQHRRAVCRCGDPAHDRLRDQEPVERPVRG